MFLTTRLFWLLLRHALAEYFLHFPLVNVISFVPIGTEHAFLSKNMAECWLTLFCRPKMITMLLVCGISLCQTQIEHIYFFPTFPVRLGPNLLYIVHVTDVDSWLSLLVWYCTVCGQTLLCCCLDACCRKRCCFWNIVVFRKFTDHLHFINFKRMIIHE